MTHTGPRAVDPTEAERKAEKRDSARFASRDRPRSQFRRWLLMCALPGLFMVGADVLRRAPRIIHFDKIHTIGYAGSALASILAWGTFAMSISGAKGTLRWVVA